MVTMIVPSEYERAGYSNIRSFPSDSPVNKAFLEMAKTYKWQDPKLLIGDHFNPKALHGRFGNGATVVISSSLVKLLNEEEQIATLGYSMGLTQKKDISNGDWKMAAFALFVLGGSLALEYKVFPDDYTKQLDRREFGIELFKSAVRRSALVGAGAYAGRHIFVERDVPDLVENKEALYSADKKIKKWWLETQSAQENSQSR